MSRRTKDKTDYQTVATTLDRLSVVTLCVLCGEVNFGLV